MAWLSKVALLPMLAAMVSTAAAERVLFSQSLATCQADSNFYANPFNFTYSPDTNRISLQMLPTSTVEGNITIDIIAYAYGYRILGQTLVPCDMPALDGICPMTAGKLPAIKIYQDAPSDAANIIPDIAYGVPDLDATVRLFVNMTDTGEAVACLETHISNSKTVDLLGVKWATAGIALLALLASAVMSSLGHANTASHIAANSLSLYAYFQSQAIIGLTAVQLPPVVQAWTQNFQWTMGVINVGFMQDIFTWYQRATGGTPATLFHELADKSVQVQKRGDGADLYVAVSALAERRVGDAVDLLRRQNIRTEEGSYVVYGIQRVAFRAGIETTNLFLTCLTFFMLFNVFAAIAVVVFRGVCELAVRWRWARVDFFHEFRSTWVLVLKGVLFRTSFLGFPLVCVLSLWEFTQNDSPALVVLAVFFLLVIGLLLGRGAIKVTRMARRSIAMHRNPAYILYADPQMLNKWGFFYIQYRASAYYFILPALAYTIVKSTFAALAQKSGVTQAIGFIILEAAALISSAVLRPWMDKSTNAFNIAIFAINFVNAILLLILSDVFDAPGLVIGVVGVVLFVLNAGFSLVLLLMVIVSTTITFFSKNPDMRYRIMADDRTSFVKSQNNLDTTTELDALAATARLENRSRQQGRASPIDNVIQYN